MLSISSKRFIRVLAGGTSLFALTFMQPATAQQGAQADQPSSSAAGALEEVIVTAQRKEEKAQTVPVSISLVTASQLQEQVIEMPNDLTKNLTGFAFYGAGTNIAGYSSTTNFGNYYQWIRGIQGVVAYWADAPTVVDAGLLFDVGNVQVLKGPQGTLFGQASNGGAIVYQPKLPGNTFGGFVEAEGGNYGHYMISGMVDIPLVDDKLLIRIGGRLLHTDGYVHDIAHDAYLGSVGNQDGRLAITFRPTDYIQNDFIGNLYTYKDAPEPYQIVHEGGIFPFVHPYSAFVPNGCGPAGLSAACLVTFPKLGWYSIPGNPNLPYFGQESGHWYNAVNTTRIDITDDLSVKNIVSYQEGGQTGQQYPEEVGVGSGGVIDLPPAYLGNPVNAFGPAGVGVQASEELQVNATLFDKLSLTVGGTVLYNQGSTAPHVTNITCARVSNPATGGVTTGGMGQSCGGTTSYQDDRSEGVYAQGTYDLSDYLEGLAFVAGVRYTWDYEYGSTYQYAGTPTTGTTPQVVGAALAGFGAKEQSKAPSYHVGVNYQMDPTTLIYFTNSLGYSKGGLTLTSSLSAPNRTFKPESLNELEAGIKADWNLPYNMKARTNVALFYGFYDNIQVVNTRPNTDAFGNPNEAVTTTNAATAHVQGTDFDLTLLPIENLSISGGGVWMKGNYDNYNYCYNYIGSTCAPGALVDVSHTAVFIYDPKWTWHIRVAYDLPIDESLGKVTIAGNLSHIGPEYGNAGPLPPNPAGGAPPPGNIEPPGNSVDFSVEWVNFLGHKGLDLHAYLTNAFQAHYYAGNTSEFAAEGYDAVIVPPPREWGFGAKYAFSLADAAPVESTPYVAPAPTPMAKAAPMGARSYMVFFDFNKSDLTPQAVTIVDQAAMNAAPAKVTQLTVTGHTDTVGSAAYNMRLSRRRAELVAAELESKGIPSSEIEIVAKGKNDLLVPTADGVKEPQNRRVQIVYDNGAMS